MKHTGIILAMLMVSVWSSFAQSDFIYTPEGEKLYFTVRKDKILITTNQEVDIASLSEEAAVLAASKINRHTAILTLNPVQTTAAEQIAQNSQVNDMTYMLENAEGDLQCPTNKIFVKCNSRYTIEQVIADIEEQVLSVEMNYPESQIYTLTLNTNLDNVLSLANALFETGLCEFAEPSFMRQIKLANTYYSDQWGLYNTGQYGGTSGCDIKAPAAWTITKGDSNIKVAVIDEGVDLTHPDLEANLLFGYDSTDGLADEGVNGGYFEDDYHGTACAGIIAALDNNIGIVGVAPQSKIISIRIMYTGGWTTDDWVANGIRLAWNDAGADILSCSWQWNATPPATINAEIENALTLGRGGKGAIIVFAAGNSNAAISYPANFHSNILVVGAINSRGERKTPFSSDIDYDTDFLNTQWGSNYGTELDLVAPGVIISTLDLQGANRGYNWGWGERPDDYADLDYLKWFRGTSAACPHVAGVAALVLSVKPELSGQQVRDIIESTAQKVGGYSYQSTAERPNGTWNNEMGYGLVDAYEAVIAAQNTGTGLEDNPAKEVQSTDCYSITGIKTDCNSNIPGVVIKRTSFTDGSTEVVKELR